VPSGLSGPLGGVRTLMTAIGRALCDPTWIETKRARVWAAMLALAERGGCLPWEKSILLSAVILPLVVRPVAMGAGVPVAPLVVFALLLVVVRRARLLRTELPV
jgi:hypothetical protein